MRLFFFFFFFFLLPSEIAGRRREETPVLVGLCCVSEVHSPREPVQRVTKSYALQKVFLELSKHYRLQCNFIVEFRIAI